MTRPSPRTELSSREIGERLAAKGDGVLSFGGEPSYAIPVSFGYDVPNDRVVFQFVFGPDSTKRRYIDERGAVTLVSYEWSGPDDWWSVVVSGRLAPIEDEGGAVAAAEVFAEYATPIGLAAFDDASEDLDPEWYELTFEAVAGRCAPALAD
ncbi:MAG: pyridoxamine 5'-phosphate oxidase family protein [Haloarculaceae archaeon]